MTTLTKNHANEPTLSRLFAQLTDLIPADVKAAWGESLKAAYERAAKESLDACIAWQRDVIRRINAKINRVWGSRGPSTRYLVRGPAEEHAYGYQTDLQRAEAELKRLESGWYTINVALAHEDAAAELVSSIETFARRGARKLVDAGLGDLATMEGSIRYIDGINAAITLTTKEGKQANLVCKGKTNYRYGNNSVNGHLTVYSQYPFKVTTY